MLSLDVLYHDDVDQEKAVAELARVLHPQGFLVLNLPAFPALAGRHDTAVSGARRYTASEVRAAFTKALELNPNRLWAKQQLDKTPAK